MYHLYYPGCASLSVRDLPALLLVVRSSFVLGVVRSPLGVLPGQLILLFLGRLRFQGQTRFLEGRMPPGLGPVDGRLAVVVVDALDRLAESLGPSSAEGQRGLLGSGKGGRLGRLCSGLFRGGGDVFRFRFGLAVEELGTRVGREVEDVATSSACRRFGV